MIEKLSSGQVEKEWILGGHNYRQDPHFSTYCLRQSTYLGQDDIYQPYSHLISLYDSFEEWYYLPRSEAIGTAEHLIEMIQADPDSFHTMLDNIERRSTELTELWEEYPLQRPFEGMTLSELANIYKKHHTLHTNLYRIARVPEALDRGVLTFTNYLRNRINEETDIDEKNSTSLFNRLTNPTDPSIIQKELKEFNILLDNIASEDPAAGALSISAELAQLFLNHSSLRQIRTHQQEWGFLWYHGYTNRSLPMLQDYVSRIRNQRWISDFGGGETKSYISPSKRSELCREYGISPELESLLSIYPRIGQVKLYRRFHQLKNFYYLDKLMEEISGRLGTREALLRHLSPEELYAAILDRDVPTSTAYRRLDGCAYVIEPGERARLKACDIEQIKAAIADQKSPASKTLEGVGITDGTAEGKARVITYSTRKNEKTISEDEVLVTQATDPDLMHLMMMASAVVTEQGGVTSHAAIVSRELGIPTVVGVTDILKSVSDGDQIKVDAQRGIVQVE